MSDPSTALRDAVYVAVGFAVIGVQRAQVRRREWERWARRTGQDLLRCGAAGRPRPGAAAPPASRPD